MRDAKISIAALYNIDDSIFEHLHLPAGVDKDIVVDNILMECVDFDILYPDPIALKWMIGAWSNRKLAEWQKIYDVLTQEYNPIWNKDGTITEGRTTTGSNNQSSTTTRNLTNTRNLTSTRNLAASSTEIRDLETSSTDSGSSSSSGTTEGQVAAYNSMTYEPRDKEINSASGTTSGSSSGTDKGSVDIDTTDTGTVSDTGSVSDTGTVSVSGSGGSTVTDTYSRRETGNIGVTTTQQMIREEMELRLNYNMISIIVEAFKTRFCVLIY